MFLFVYNFDKNVIGVLIIAISMPGFEFKNICIIKLSSLFSCHVEIEKTKQRFIILIFVIQAHSGVTFHTSQMIKGLQGIIIPIIPH